MAEKIVLPAPEPATTEYRVSGVEVYHDDPQNGHMLRVSLVSDVGKKLVVARRGDTILPTVVALNKANLSVKSLHRRALEWAVSMGECEGTIEGTPD